MKRIGTIASLHVAPLKRGGPMRSVRILTLVEGKGISESPRRGGRDHRPARMKGDDDPSWREVSFIHRDEIQEHERTLVARKVIRSGTLTPGKVRADIELIGYGGEIKTYADFLKLRGRRLLIGEEGAGVEITIQRDPCGQMNQIQDVNGRRCVGLLEEMKGGRMGFFAKIFSSGRVKDGEGVYLLE